MKGHLFIVPGDLTCLSAHAVAYSANHQLGRDGNMYSAFRARMPGFDDHLTRLRGQHAGRCQVGDAFWVPLDPVRRPHGMVLTISTGGPARDSGEDKASLAVEGALVTSLYHLRFLLGSQERLLIALPTFRVGQGGDRRQRLRSARAQVETALRFLQDRDRVDVAFIPYTIALTQIFLEARREVLAKRSPPVTPQNCRAPGGLGSPEPPKCQIQQAEPIPPAGLVEALRSRECVLFVGAGLSSGAGLPDWASLIQRLRADLDVEPHVRADYLDLAQWYRERLGQEALAQVIQDTFGIDALPTLGHYLLMSLPVRQVITTNYDELLERALISLKRYPVKVVRQQDVARTGQAGVFVVKLHGDVEHPEEVVLTRDDYEEFFERRPALALLLEGLLLNQTFFFVGYSLRDPNFRQIHGRIARMLREAFRPAFATSWEAGAPGGEYLSQQWANKQVQLIPIAGDSAEDKEQQFLRFLDALSDQVSLPRPHLFLAPEVAVSHTLRPLRNTLIEKVGAQLEQLGEQDLAQAGEDQTHYLTEVLRFLTSLGWRPAYRRGWDLSQLWEYLAAHTADAGEQRRLLITALENAEAYTDVERIRNQIAQLEADSCSSQG